MLDNVSDLIYGLERINQIIDLCIDRELYEYVKKILRPGRKGLQYIKELRNTDGKISLEEFDFSIIQFPVLEITTPSDPEKAELFQFPQLFKSEKPDSLQPNGGNRSRFLYDEIQLSHGIIRCCPRRSKSRLR